MCWDRETDRPGCSARSACASCSTATRRAAAAPSSSIPCRRGRALHRHSREDEYSFVLEGRVGALLGDEVVHGEVGDLIFKPRGQWHTFWNDGSQHARILELISPAGFERYFEEVVELLRQPGPPRRGALSGIAARYGLEFDRESIPRLTQQYDLHFGPPAE